MITPVDLAAIKARLDAAAPGPWWTDGKRDREDDQVWVMGTDGDVVAFVEDWMCGFSTGGPDRGYAEGNADLIANAPTDIAALLGALEEARGLLAEARQGFHTIWDLDTTAAMRREAIDVAKRIDAVLGSAGA